MSAVEQFPDLPEPGRRELVQLVGGRLHEYAVVAEQLVSAEVYVRGATLARIGLPAELPSAERQGIERNERQSVLISVSAEYLRRRLTELADFQVYRRREKEWMSVDCPKDLAANIIGMGDWPNFRPLTAIASAPFIRPDLTICDTPGYDAATGVYLQPAYEFPTIPSEPTREDADAARAFLLEPFGEFPYAAPEHKAVFAAHVLTATVRVTLPTSPLFFYSAPTAATGKTLLARMPSFITTGVDPALHPHTDDGEELRKVLFASLLAGDSTLVFDNVPNGMKIRSPVLCGFLTAPTFGDRRLGVSENRKLPNRVVVALTGNNITATGDAARRSLVCRLDANAESARGREFKIPNLVEHVTRLRPQLFAAALTIVRAYIVAGCPRQAHALESFENWSQLCRDPLMWLGMANAVDSQEGETDEEIDVLRAAFKALATAYGPREFTARDLADAMGPPAMGVREALASAGCSDPGDAIKVGYWLRAARDKVAADLKLRSRSGHQSIGTWRLTRMKSGGA